MNVWQQIVNNYVEAPKPQPKKKQPVTEKMCVGCKQVKPRDQFYTRPGHSPNALSSRCKPCHSKHVNSRYMEYKI